MSTHRTVILVLVASAVLLLGGSAQADWPNFRGPKHDGISAEKGLKITWEGKPPLVWERNIGSGFSSFAAAGDKVYTCGTEEMRQVLFCLAADTGEVIWQKPIEKAYVEPVGGDGPRATPTLDDGRVYILGALGKLMCFDAYTGKELWKTKFNNMPQWGYSGSVLIEGDLAIASGGKGNGALVAFDKTTGKVAWRCGKDSAGYATPYPMTLEGKRYIVGFTGESVIIGESKTGNLVWREPWVTDWSVNASSPIFHDGHLFISSGYKTGAGLFKMRKDGEKLAGDSIWKSKVLLNKFQSCILHEGKLYTSDQEALVCVDFMTGEEQWRKRRLKHGTVVLAEDNLLLLTESGLLQVAKASPEGFDTISKARILDGRCWTVPMLHRGKLYARNLERAVCFDLKAE
ncbi:MAG: PQQ-like beta-propeller repeat protein [Phycisphaerales bacterium]|nr:MAG: PQQ-like beta-propeller repeat protein [Phycisphaerales bacterium]